MIKLTWPPMSTQPKIGIRKVKTPGIIYSQSADWSIEYGLASYALG